MPSLRGSLPPLLPAAGYPEQPADEVMVRRISTISERAKTLVDLLDHGSWYWAAADAVEYDDAKARRKFLKHESVGLLQAIRDELSALAEDSWTLEGIEPVILAIAERFELKLGKVSPFE